MGPVSRSILAIFAHPDDETFACGGTIPRYADAGIACHLYCATDGDAGRASGVAMGACETLGARRRRELHEAARLLGFTSVRTAGHPDGRLAAVDADALIGELVELIRTRRPGIVLTFGPEGARNGHRDHRAISRAATAAFFAARLATAYSEQLESLAPHAPARLYNVSWDEPAADQPMPLHALPITARVEASRWREVQRAAFHAHETQRDHLERFEMVAGVPDDCYALAAGVPQPAPLVDDLFAGL